MTDVSEISEASLQRVRLLGQGAFATVELCLYTAAAGGQPRTVACKRIKPGMAKLVHEAQPFELEVCLMRKLRHKNIVEFIGVSESHEAKPCHSVIRVRPPAAQQKPERPSSPRHPPPPPQQQQPESAACPPLQTCSSSSSNSLMPSPRRPYDSSSSVELLSLSNHISFSFVVEEYLDGGSLRQAVVHQMDNMFVRTYRNEDALRWMAGVAAGLRYLHEAQPMVVHRDLKLENIMLQVGGGSALPLGWPSRVARSHDTPEAVATHHLHALPSISTCAVCRI